MLNIETPPQPSDLNVKQPNAADVKHRSLENAKQSNPATEMRMLNKSENVKQRHDPIVKQSSSPAGRMSYLGVRIPPELLGAIDAMAGSRSKTVRELLQFALDVKQRGK